MRRSGTVAFSDRIRTLRVARDLHLLPGQREVEEDPVVSRIHVGEHELDGVSSPRDRSTCVHEREVGVEAEVDEGGGGALIPLVRILQDRGH